MTTESKPENVEQSPVGGSLDPLVRGSGDKKRDQQKCPRCNGEGLMNWYHHEISQRVLCERCKGTGTIATSALYRMTIATVIHTYDPTTERHARCMPTHPKDTLYHKPGRYIKVKDYLALGLELNRDIVVFTNDDVAFPEGSFDRIRVHVSEWDYGCSRRPRIPTHIGREIFWFSSKWLKEHFDSVPEAYWGVPKPDLILARWMRNMRGIETTFENLYLDFYPVELCEGIVTHECHESHWNTPAILNCPESKENERLWKEMGPIKER